MSIGEQMNQAESSLGSALDLALVTPPELPTSSEMTSSLSTADLLGNVASEPALPASSRNNFSQLDAQADMMAAISGYNENEGNSDSFSAHVSKPSLRYVQEQRSLEVPENPFMWRVV